METRMLFPQLTMAKEEFMTVKLEEVINTSEHDSVVIIGTSLNPKSLGPAAVFGASLSSIEETDAAFECKLTCLEIEGTQIVYSPTGPLNNNQDDNCIFTEAAIIGVKSALSAGAKRLVVVLPKIFKPYTDFEVDFAVFFGALEAIYMHLAENPGRRRKVNLLGFANFNGDVERFRIFVSSESERIERRYIKISGGKEVRAATSPMYCTSEKLIKMELPLVDQLWKTPSILEAHCWSSFDSSFFFSFRSKNRC